MLRKYRVENKNDMFALAWLAKYLLKSDPSNTEAILLLCNLVQNLKPYDFVTSEITQVVDNEGMGDTGFEPVTSAVCKKHKKRGAGKI